jgi:hypothetical protein
VVHACERQLVLANHQHGVLAHDLSDYLFARTTGYFGSLTALINRAAARAMRTGVEALTEEILEKTVIDVAANAERETAEGKLRVARRNRERNASKTSRQPVR